MIMVRSWPPRPAVLLAVSIAISLPMSWWGLARLADERSRLAQTEGMALVGAHPRVPPLPSAMAFADPDRGTAIARFGAALAKAATSHRLLVERLEILPARRGQEALLTAEIALSGNEADIRKFASTIEGGMPAIRFASWRIARAADGESAVRIEAEALALWEPGT